MRRALQDTKENLTEFVQQGDYCLLLVGTADNDVPWILKIQEQLASETPGTLYFAFPDEFVSKDAYALEVANRLSLLLALENEQRQADSRETLEPFPDSMLAPRTAPKERLLVAFEHMTQWLTDPSEQRVVMTLMPLSEPPPEYYLFVSEFAIHKGVREPWMDNGRVIARDERATHVTSLACTMPKPTACWPSTSISAPTRWPPAWHKTRSILACRLQSACRTTCSWR